MLFLSRFFLVSSNEVSSNEKLLNTAFNDLGNIIAKHKLSKRSVSFSDLKDDIQIIESILENANQNLSKFLVTSSTTIIECCPCPSPTTLIATSVALAL